ncbi:serine hydrolase [Sphingomonas lacunae]|uniref:Serine hydrolase n=1 Tax=Sphingomonas lacunae TaxID=2698828 RepID=A0A6M4B2H0_9SPHN|nr:serine hydrolase [Sphingomonas lacunae]
MAQQAPSAPNALPTPTPQQESLAAGYVALTTCSAVFTARRMGAERTLESIRENELRGVYPDIDRIVQTQSTFDDGVSFSAGWDRNMPARRAVLDLRTDGCTLEPVGSGVASRDHVHHAPGRTEVVFRPVRLHAPWPLGDRDALARPARGAETDRLDGAIRAAFDGGFGQSTNTTAVVIVQNGRIIREQYKDGFGIHVPQRTWSVAKSIAATIVGSAAHRGEADVAAPAAIANWQRDNDPRRAITLDQLLRMASGLTSDTAGNRTDAIYFGGTTVDEQAPGWPLIAPPGSTFRYANNDTLLAVLAISPTFAQHPPRVFFESINMHATVAETDWRGNYVLSSQVWSTARDLARFGMLYLNDGVWNGQRILPEGWRTYVTTPSGPQPPGEFGYGASFWLLNRSEGVPPDTFAAFGNRGQYVVIVPSRNIVIVRRGEDPAGARFDIAAFTRELLAALE